MRLSVVATLYRSAPYLRDFHRRVSVAARRFAGDDYEKSSSSTMVRPTTRWPLPICRLPMGAFGSSICRAISPSPGDVDRPQAARGQ